MRIVARSPPKSHFHKMKTFSRLVLSAALLMNASCSCGIIGGETYVSSGGSREISGRIVEEFAKEAKYRRTSESTYRKGSVDLNHDEMLHGFRILGSFCGFPHELLFSSSKKVADEVSGAQSEAEKWFMGRGYRLRVSDQNQRSAHISATAH